MGNSHVSPPSPRSRLQYPASVTTLYLSLLSPSVYVWVPPAEGHLDDAQQACAAAPGCMAFETATAPPTEQLRLASLPYYMQQQQSWAETWNTYTP